MVFGGRAFERCFGHEGGVISALIKETPESLPLLPCEGQSPRTVCVFSKHGGPSSELPMAFRSQTALRDLEGPRTEAAEGAWG